MGKDQGGASRHPDQVIRIERLLKRREELSVPARLLDSSLVSRDRNDRQVTVRAIASQLVEDIEAARERQPEIEDDHIGVERFEGAAVFVLPNPSGRNANFSYAQMLAAFRSLKPYARG